MSFSELITCPRSSQLKETMKWVDDNFETRDSSLLARHSVYEVYLNFCDTLNYAPVPSASFGKRFRTLVTRRLGTRGQSKYHYQGVDFKPNSPYKYLVPATVNDPLQKKRVSRDSNPLKKPASQEVMSFNHLETQNVELRLSENETIKSNTTTDLTELDNMTRSFLPTKKDTSVKLPEFPNLSNFPGIIDEKQLNLFMVMYRAHCQRLLDMAFIADFDEMKRHLIHFWKTFPTHFDPLLEYQFVIDLIAVCDVLTYDAVNRSLVPNLRVEIHQSIRTCIIAFVSDLPKMLVIALKDNHVALRVKKIEVAQRLKSKVEKELKVSFLHQTCKDLLRNSNNCKRLLFDLRNVYQSELWCRMKLIELEDPINVSFTDIFKKFYSNLLLLLEGYCTVKKLLSLVEKVFDIDTENTEKTLLLLFYLLNLISLEITLKNAPSFDIFVILRLLIEEYALARLENVAFQRYRDQHLNQLNDTYWTNIASFSF